MARTHEKQADELTAAEIRFCERVLEHRNATKAFKEAGLTAKTEVAIRRAACTLLSKQNVRRYLDELYEKMMAAANAGFQEHLNRLRSW